ncbi:hypothetical protein N5923_06045 [Erwiniaceae bacterium BAC15a-03b]|uniref:Uncharacterized protein n=1 Tax=Winslowiella arboricola TaxID=2978220 RepID=A0A9J6PKQ8_9GAMM|nr:hypothetical protein [Winslowiella arboricola]MCU5771318.1 hypothetical protein [Winslowiella arboricola]MCU5777051.1 hypothetical protein [Winslowiella arboricola]
MIKSLTVINSCCARLFIEEQGGGFNYCCLKQGVGGLLIVSFILILAVADIQTAN